MGPKEIVKVVVTQEFSATPERVFDAWLDPKMIGQWMFGKNLRDEEIISLTSEPKLGGGFSFVVDRQGQKFDHCGHYFQFEQPNRLGFTWMVNAPPSDSSRIFVEIERTATGCNLTLTHELHPDWADFKAITEAGWTKMLGMLSTFLSVK